MYSLVLHLQITGQSLQFVQKIVRLPETYHSKPAMFSTNQRQHCLARVLPLLGVDCMFSRAWQWLEQRLLFLLFFFLSALGSTHGKSVPRLSSAEAR